MWVPRLALNLVVYLQPAPLAIRYQDAVLLGVESNPVGKENRPMAAWSGISWSCCTISGLVSMIPIAAFDGSLASPNKLVINAPSVPKIWIRSFAQSHTYTSQEYL